MEYTSILPTYTVYRDICVIINTKTKWFYNVRVYITALMYTV